jgi:hypothetical protein
MNHSFRRTMRRGSEWTLLPRISRMALAAIACRVPLQRRATGEIPELTLHADLSAGGRARALRILQMARYEIEWRAAQARTTPRFVPDAGHPLLVIVIDEVAELSRPGGKLAAAITQELAFVASKGHSERVALAITSQPPARSAGDAR